MPSPNYDSPDNMSIEELNQNLQSSKYPQTDSVTSSNLEQLFKVPENPQYNYATFTEAFEKYKVKIDLFKWLIGTVGLTIITFIINWGFKDREQGIAELQVYDKYASENVVYAENPKNRMLLAEFFANVTPSKKLKNGWKDYLKVVSVEVDSFNNRLLQSQKLVAVLAKDTNQSQQAKEEYIQAKDVKQELERINSLSLTDDIVTPISFQKTSVENRNEDLAKSFEENGFKALLSKNLDDAIYNFKMSENSYNGYHIVYDISKYLTTIKTNFSNNNEDWKNIYKVVLKNYSWRMPNEIKNQLIAASK